VPVRIYALAKELDIDSKDLVDLVKKAGITGKGSALASLTDDEAVQVRESLSSAPKPAPPVPPAATATKELPTQPVAPVRDLDRSATRRPIAIQSSRPKTREISPSEDTESKRSAPALRSPALKPATPAAPPSEPTSPKPEVRLKDVMPSRPSGQPAKPSSAPTSTPPASTHKPGTPASLAKSESGVPTAESGTTATPPGKSDATSGAGATVNPPAGGMASRIADRMASNSGGRVVPNRPGEPVRRDGMSSGGKMRSLDRAVARTGGDKPVDPAKAKKREPRIKVNLAQMPTAPPPKAPIASSGPAQKPDIKLTRDVIEGHKQGMKAPLARLEKDDADKKRIKTEAEAGAGQVGRRKIVEEEEKPRGKKGLSGMASARADRARGGGGRRVIGSGDQDRSHMRRNRPRIRRKGTNTAAPRKERVQLELPCTVRSFCEAAGVTMSDVMKTLMGMGMMININSQMDLETAVLIATELSLEIELKAAESLEDELITEIETQEDTAESLLPRAPIVTFLGHVDHGKTSLLDHLIGINVVKGEAGGITQHIRAYHVERDETGVTFVDTPGHEAFTEMRARGANVTDIAVLVVAADDGVMPQTEEAISHAKAAEVPIVVALNKVDLEGVDINRVMTQLTEYGLTPSEWGGDVEVVRTSATTGQGMDELLETLLTVAELNEYTANPNRSALGVCLESEQHGDKGVLAKIVVQNGTLRVGDIIVCGPAHGRVRSLRNTLTGKLITEAGPSMPATLTGLDTPPGPGDRFHVLKDITQAREIAGSREDESSRQSLSGITTKVSFDSFQDMLAGGTLGGEEPAKLNLIIRADARGSLEAIDKELSKFDHPEVEIRVLQRSVGGITLADATLASASDAVILGFNVVPDEKARLLADQRNIEIRRYNIIYKLTDDIKMMIEGRLKPEERVVELGRALVKQVFSISRVGTIAGCYVAQGSILRGCRIRVSRDGRVIGEYPLDTLRRIKEDVKEVPRGMECGIRLSGFNDIKQDDVLEAYRIEQVARKLE